MALAGTKRKHGLTSDPLFRALLISIVVHLCVFGGWKLGNALELWRYVPSFVSRAVEEKLLTPKPAQQANKPQEREIQLTFLEVDPTQAALEAPKDAKFYGAVSTEAANPKPAEKETVEIDGKQKEFLKITENEKQKAQPLQPTPEPTPDIAEEIREEEIRPKKQEEVGDLAIAKPAEKKRDDTGKAETEKKGEPKPKTRSRPRTLAEARKGVQGEKSPMEGGVKKYDLNSSLAVKGSIVGNYDHRFIQAVRQRWDMLLEQVSSTKPGKVILEFRIHHDGRISEMKVLDSNVGEFQSLLCQKAILDPAPYDKWPMDMRRELKGNTRDVTFTFYYSQ
jgi:hypothetical protein